MDWFAVEKPEVKGRTPYDVFKAGIPKKSPSRKKSARKEFKTAARPDLGEPGCQVNAVLVTPSHR